MKRSSFSESSVLRPRVLHVVPAMFGGAGVVGGAERYVLELAREMAKTVPTRLLTFGDEERTFIDGDLPIRVMGRSHYVRGQRANPFKLSAVGELRDADVVHCHQKHITISTFLAMAGRFSRKPVFVTDLGGGGWDVSSYVNTDRLFAGHLHISEYSLKVFGHRGNLRARVIGGGVDAERFSPGDRGERGKNVLFVGRLLPHKGLDVLIRALPEHLSLDIIGKPYDGAYYADLVRLSAGKRISFHHDCTDDQLVDAYRSALCIVLPSVYTDMYGRSTTVPELLGQTLLEGMACAAPAVATKVASLAEIVEDDVSGFVVPPNDSEVLRERLTRLASDGELARRLGDAARRRVLEHFRWSSVVTRCLEAYG